MTQTQATTERMTWLRARQAGFGGSDAAVFFDCNPWASLGSLYHSKVDEIEEEDEDAYDNPSTFWGNQLEAPVRDAYCRIVGRNVTDGVKMLAHPDFPHIIANTDGTLEPIVKYDGPGVYEGKVTNFTNAADWELGIPLYYEVQANHYMAVTGYKWASVACLIMGERDPFVWRDIERNEKFIEALLEREDDFWRKHVVPRIPPPIDGHPATTRALKLLHPNDNGRIIFLPAEVGTWWTERLEVKDEMKALDKRADELGNKVLDAIGPNSYGMFEDGTGVSCKSQSGRRTGKAVLEALDDVLASPTPTQLADLADVVKENTYRSTYRVMRKASPKTLAKVQKGQDREDAAKGEEG